jgi:hypothetical protein
LAAGIRYFAGKADAIKPVVIDTLTSDESSIAALSASGLIRRGYQRLNVKRLTNRLLPANIHYHDGWAIFSDDLDVY